MEEAVEHDDPTVQRGQRQLQHALYHVGPVELAQGHQAVGNGRLQVLLRDYQHHAPQRHQPRGVPARMRAGSGNSTVRSLDACASLAVGPEGSQMTTKGWHSATQDTGNKRKHQQYGRQSSQANGRLGACE